MNNPVPVSPAQKLKDRIDWLEQKLTEMRRVGGPDFNSSKRLHGRTEGEIGGLRWVLKEVFNESR